MLFINIYAPLCHVVISVCWLILTSKFLRQFLPPLLLRSRPSYRCVAVDVQCSLLSQLPRSPSGHHALMAKLRCVAADVQCSLLCQLPRSPPGHHVLTAKLPLRGRWRTVLAVMSTAQGPVAAQPRHSALLCTSLHDVWRHQRRFGISLHTTCRGRRRYGISLHTTCRDRHSFGKLHPIQFGQASSCYCIGPVCLTPSVRKDWNYRWSKGTLWWVSSDGYSLLGNLW